MCKTMDLLSSTFFLLFIRSSLYMDCTASVPLKRAFVQNRVYSSLMADCVSLSVSGHSLDKCGRDITKTLLQQLLTTTVTEKTSK